MKRKHKLLITVLVLFLSYADTFWLIIPTQQADDKIVQCLLVKKYEPQNVQTGKSSYSLKQAADFQCPNDKIYQGYVDPYRSPELYTLFDIKSGCVYGYHGSGVLGIIALVLLLGSLAFVIFIL